MSLKTQLTDDMKQAMRDRNSLKLNTIRFLLAEVRNFEIDNGEQDDAGILKVIGKQVKQMKDAISEFEKGGRSDLVAEEQSKVEILQTYLPQQLSDEELEAVVAHVIANAPVKQMGPVMQAVRAEVGDRADGSRLAEVVKKQLAA